MTRRICLGTSWMLILLFFSQLLSAQVSSSGGKVSQMSDQQIQQMWLQAQKSGMSESDAMKLLIQRGMSPSDVNTFKKRLVGMQGSSKNTTGQVFVRDTTNFLHDSSWVSEIPLLKKRTPYYGYDFFNNPTVSFEPSLIASPPANYKLGPGDEITINVTGINETTISNRISREGNFEVPHFGVINIGGLTLEEATRKLKATMQSGYPSLATGGTKLILTFDKVRTINVIVQGEAERVGKYTVSALTGFINLLYLSGGPNLIGSLRSIEHIRNGKVIETIDFYTFLQKGMLTNTSDLQDMDIIRFPVYNKRVLMTGQVKRPAIYELLDKESLSDLIKYAGGFGDTAYRQSVTVTQIGDAERSIRTITARDYNIYIPHNADSIYVDRILARYSNRVIITGAVRRPGDYELTTGNTVANLIRTADGVREDAFSNRGNIFRRQADNGSRTLVSFDVKRLLSGADPDIPLIREDSVVISAIDSLQDQLTITVGGSVRSPGVFQFRRGTSLADAIIQAGGFSNDAATHKVEIQRLEKNTADTLANKLITTLTLDVDPALNPSANNSKTLLEPLDYIFVPRLLNYRNLGNIRLRGEVLYSGDYSLERRDETIQELITRAGGISPYASLKDVQVYRNGLRVATTIFAEGSNQRFLLLPGDSIFIPRNEPFVEVKGFVFTPQVLEFKSRRFLSYISGAGGATDKGNLGKSYIQYSNGINKRIRHFLFFRKYPPVLPGSKIIVPERTELDRRGISALELTTITGVLTALIAAISLFK